MVVIFIQVIARVFIHRGTWLACDDNGWLWLHTTLLGSFFFIGHMMIIVMQSVMVERVFYSIPHKMHWFDHKHVSMLGERKN